MMGSPDLRARVIIHTMVRPHLLIIYLFLVIHTQAASIVVIYNVTRNSTRRCDRYTRCRTSLPFDDSSTLASGSRMRYGGNVTSENGAFMVGFFVDDRKNNAYLGTWYNLSTYPKVIVWVANRDNPMPYRLRHSCSLAIADDGNAVLFDSNTNHSYWSTPSNPSDPARTYLQISDDGNLVLFRNGDTTTNLWQSFDNPTDTFLPGMDIRQGGINLTSWKSPQDPSEGNYSFGKAEGEESNELIIYDSSESPPFYWASKYSSLHPFLTPLLSKNMTDARISSRTLRLVMNATGSLQLWELEKDDREWSLLWVAPKDQCDLYEPCGSYGVCDADNGFRCKCLPGYRPNNPVKWESEDFSSGCLKNTNDLCHDDMFLRLPMIKLPPGQPLHTHNETYCKGQCSCGCRAYTFDAKNSSCLIWKDDLTHIQEEYYNVSAHTLNIRINHSDIDSGSRTCKICGTNVVPYPLSTNRSCGDPKYFNFECNDTNGQVYFKPPSGRAYKVSHINPNQRMFTLQLNASTSVLTDYKCETTHNIASKTFNLSDSSAFNVTKCSIAQLVDRKVVEVDVSWKPPLQPPCSSSEDCKDWPESTCDGKKVCICTNGFYWDSLNVNCSKDMANTSLVVGSTADDHRWHMPLLLKVVIASAAGLLLLSAVSVVIHVRRRRNITNRAGVVDQFKMDEMEDIDIPFFDYESILVATDNFSDANMLGAGGFGPVYKGLLAEGNEVAVKRLSVVSLQGVQEFRNEIILIAKLQHRNLVRVLGYCIKEDEKILIYEYMPNKSLDSFLFDQFVSPLLDWTKRFNIILGIARGLLYLHQDSRLRIIHRDLKPSNILLDEELNPKISDFGLAKIVAGNELAASTARVAGTYGYMSPEYALDGYFSIKSDVYSFGIIVFEVISGRRCTSLLQLDNSLVSLLGYAWALWGEGRELELADKAMADTYDSLEVKRCINVAFLCAQEDPSDRPTMSSAVLMLSGDSINLPHPKQPVFVARRQPLETTSSSSMPGTSSNVYLTTTVLGR